MQPSMSSVGKTIRMNRIFKPDGRAVMIAINHGIAMGPAKGMEDLNKLFEKIVPENPDSFTIHKGAAMRTMDTFAGKVAFIMKCTNSTRFFTPEEIPVSCVTEAVKLGADAIAIGLSLAAPFEQSQITQVGRIVEEAERYGLPTVTHSYPIGSLVSNSERYSVENVGYATRVSLELGVDIIKTYWTGSQASFAKIVEYGSPAKVVISGGPKCETLRQCFDMTRQGIDAGASGITYGRNVWQHEYPDAVLRGLVAIVHKNATVDEAMEIAEDCAHARLV